MGAYLSDLFLRLLGVGTFWIPVFMLISSVRIFRREDFEMGFLVPLGFAGLMFSTSALVSLLLSAMGITIGSHFSGGEIGAYSARSLVTLLNRAGSYILMPLIFSISLILTIDLSFVSFIRRFFEFCNRKVADWSEFHEARQQREEKREIQEESGTDPAPKAPNYRGF